MSLTSRGWTNPTDEIQNELVDEVNWIVHKVFRIPYSDEGSLYNGNPSLNIDITGALFILRI